MIVLLFLISSGLASILYDESGAHEFGTFLIAPKWCSGQFQDLKLNNMSIRELTEDPCGNTFYIPVTPTISVIDEWGGVGCTPESTAEKLAPLGYKAMVIGARWQSDSMGYVARSSYFVCGTSIPLYRAHVNDKFNVASTVSLVAEHNSKEDLAPLLVSIIPRSIIIVTIALYKLAMCFHIVLAQMKVPTGARITYLVVALEALSSVCAVALLGDVGFFIAVLPYRPTFLLTNAMFLLSNLSTLTMAQVLLYTLHKVVPSTKSHTIALIFFAVSLPVLQIYVALGGAQIIESFSFVVVLNLFVGLILNMFSCIFFLAYKRKISRMIATPASRAQPSGSISKLKSPGIAPRLSTASSYQGNMRRVLKMALLLRISGYFGLVVVILGPIYTVGIFLGNFYIFSWAFFFSGAILQCMGVIQLLSLSTAENAGYKHRINQILDRFDNDTSQTSQLEAGTRVLAT